MLFVFAIICHKDMKNFAIIIIYKQKKDGRSRRNEVFVIQT